MTLHFFNDLTTDAKSNKLENYVIIAKLINRIPGLRLLMSSLSGSALRTHVESLCKPGDVNRYSQSLA